MMDYSSSFQISQTRLAKNPNVIGETYMQHTDNSEHIVSVDNQGRPVYSWSVYLIFAFMVIAAVVIGSVLVRARRNLKEIKKNNRE